MGVLYGVGVGPGDPELLTLKAVRLIQQASVVFVPVAAGGAPSFARTIASRYLDAARQEIVELAFPVVRERPMLTEAWDTAASTVLKRLTRVESAVFLTEGDPLLYSTFIHLYRAVRRRAPEQAVEVVPGVMSFSAAAAAVGFPLAAHNGRVAIVPAPRDTAILRPTLRAFDTTVLLKVAPVFDCVLDALEELGLAEHAIWVRRVGRPEQQVEHDIRRLRGCALDYFSLLIVHNPAPIQERDT